MRSAPHDEALPHVVAIDYGSKRNIFRNLADAGARVTVLPATATFDEVMAHEPDGFFLSNGPGDPAATGEYAVPVIRQMLETGKPLFGICLGHQLLGLAVGARTSKMHQGHRGANHPVKRLADGRVEITSMNHGFAVEAESLPANRPLDPYQPVRRQPLRPGADRPPGVQRAISSGGEPGAAGQRLSVREVRRDAGDIAMRTVPLLLALTGLGACDVAMTPEAQVQACVQRFAPQLATLANDPLLRWSVRYAFELYHPDPVLLREGIDGAGLSSGSIITGSNTRAMAEAAVERHMTEEGESGISLIDAESSSSWLVYAPERLFSSSEGRNHLATMCALASRGFILRRFRVTERGPSK